MENEINEYGLPEKFSGENNPRYGNHAPLSEETKKKNGEIS